MTNVTVHGQVYPLSMNGFLQNPRDWCPEVGLEIARRERLEMTEEHWAVIDILREYHLNNHVVPMIRDLLKKVGERLGKERANIRYLYTLYPCGPFMQALKIAGLPMPCRCD
ncbi:MAG: TusE/DsrC/DsvC family sulfur relay protein [Magnetococcales bacterium]|nr:TusE/DsrC/DsvC family sulfur relay protein [Magnetococcales bacterium]